MPQLGSESKPFQTFKGHWKVPWKRWGMVLGVIGGLFGGAFITGAIQGMMSRVGPMMGVAADQRAQWEYRKIEKLVAQDSAFAAALQAFIDEKKDSEHIDEIWKLQLDNRLTNIESELERLGR